MIGISVRCAPSLLNLGPPHLGLSHLVGTALRVFAGLKSAA
jgi:hypothetical protein